MLKNWDFTRKSYISWLSNTLLRKQFFKHIKFDDLSLWWVTNLMNKDNRNNIIWYSRLNKKLNNEKDTKIYKINYLKFFVIFIKKFISTILSNIIDSYTFFFSAFYNSENIYMSENWIEIAGYQTIIKIIIGIVFFLPVYGILLNILIKKMIDSN